MTSRQSAERHDVNAEAEIRELIDRWRRALHAKDVDAFLSTRAPDALAYDLAPPLLHRGADVFRKNLQAWFPTWDGPIEYDVRDLDIQVGGDLAVSTSLNRLRGKKTDGEQADVWIRATVVYRKTDGRWLVTHEHESVPFYMDGSYKAAVDLRP
jgi:PhnB protein